MNISLLAKKSRKWTVIDAAHSAAFIKIKKSFVDIYFL